MNENVELEYGMKILFPCTRLNYVPILNIGLKSSSDKEEMVEMVVTKYRSDDTSPNGYKVKLTPTAENDILAFGSENLYSSDLKQLIKQGTAKIMK